ncbi:MAG: YtxH domain-containing protein [Bacteroidales bacterium]|nr:YtxH domain-containing protein [Bacteroidales bacterium]
MDFKHLFSFIGGLATGAIIALLLAPDKGSETRRKISEKLKEKGIDLSSEELDNFIETLKEKIGCKNEKTTSSEENTDEVSSEQ